MFGQKFYDSTEIVRKPGARKTRPTLISTKQFNLVFAIVLLNCEVSEVNTEIIVVVLKWRL